MAPQKSGAAPSTVQSRALKRCTAASQTPATSGSMLRRPRFALKPMRLGGRPRRMLAWNPPGGTARESGSCGLNAAMASSMRATSDTLRAIGPSTQRLSKAGKPSPRGTMPALGRKPTMPQKLAGMRSEPPRQEPFASQTSCAANAAAAPPDEPPAVRVRFQGLRVIPQTKTAQIARWKQGPPRRQPCGSQETLGL